MSNSRDSETVSCGDQRTLCLASGIRCGAGVVLLILSLVAVGFYMDMTTRGLPYFIGAVFVGVVLSFGGVLSYFYWRRTGTNASLLQKTHRFRLELGISATALVFGLFGIIVLIVNGIQTPVCLSVFSNCSVEAYRSSSNYKMAITLLVMLLLCIILSIVCLVMQFRAAKADGINIGSSKSGMFPENRHRGEPIQGAMLHTADAPSGSGQTVTQSGPIAVNYRHGQPETFGGAVLSQPGVPNTYYQTSQGPIVVNSRGGHSGEFGGAILSQPGGPSSNYQSTTQVIMENHPPIVKKYRHGQPEAFEGAVLSRPGDSYNMPPSQGPQGPPTYGVSHDSGYALGTRHGQPQPFAGAVMSTGSQRPNDRQNEQFISQLQDENRILREQLAARHGNHQVSHSELSDPPPSYESCLKDPSKVKYLEEQNRNMKNLFQQTNHPSPSAPPM